jgi:hypothetical protein
MDAHPKFLVILDLEARAVRIEGGYILGEYSSREDAEKAARLRGLKMPEATLKEPPIRQPSAH